MGRLCLVALLFLALPVGAGASSHEAALTDKTPTKEWDDKAVARLLRSLAEETKHVQEKVGRYVSESPEGSPRRIVLHDVYEIHHRVISLESGVRAGLGRRQTEPVFRRMLQGVRNAQRDMQDFPAIEEARRHIEKADALIRELEGYYGVYL